MTFTESYVKKKKKKKDLIHRYGLDVYCFALNSSDPHHFTNLSILSQSCCDKIERSTCFWTTHSRRCDFSERKTLHWFHFSQRYGLLCCDWIVNVIKFECIYQHFSLITLVACFNVLCFGVVINAENAAHQSEKFATMATRTRQEYLKDLVNNYTSSTSLETNQKFCE